MADSYRPPGPGYDYGRRTSFSNPTWRREQVPLQEPSPPRGLSRPSAPPRANTMDPRRDSRQKRPSSRSPDGTYARKALKPAQFNESTSRRSSMSNGTPKHPNGLASSPDARNIAQTSKDTRSLPVDLPNARDSPMRDTSGRSTPLGKTNGISTSKDEVAVNGSSSNINSEKANASTTPDAILALLQNFSNEVAQHAALQISHDQAKARADQLQLEWNSTRDKHAAFPAIKERKTAAKDAAHKERRARAEELNAHKASRIELMTTLATMISQNVACADHVSRAEHTDLGDRFNKAQEMIKTQMKQLEQLSENATEMHKANETLSSRLNTHQKDTSAELGNVKKQIDSLGSTAKTLATKDALDKLEKQHERQRQQLDKKVTNLGNDATKLKQDAESMATSVRDMPSPLSDEDKAKVEQILVDAPPAIKKLSNVETKVDDVVKKVDDLKLQFDGEAAKQKINSVGDASKTGNVNPNYKKQLTDFQHRLEAVEKDIAGIEDGATDRDREIAEYVEGQLQEVRKNWEMEKVEQLHAKIVKHVDEATARQVPLERVESLESDLQARSKRAEEDIEVLKTQLKQFTAKSQAQLVQPALHQLPNGIGQPLAPNEVSRSQSLSTAPPPRHGSPQGTMQPPGNVPDLTVIHRRVDGLVGAVQDIKQRMDNVTTDEITRKMEHQFTQMYPPAKNFDATMNNISVDIRSLRASLNKETSARNVATDEIHRQISDTKKRVDEMKGTMRGDLDKELNSAYERAQKQLMQIEVGMEEIKGRFANYEAYKES